MQRRFSGLGGPLARAMGAAVLLVLQACGGGGGGDESGSGGPPRAASMIPAAPATGAVLVADAATLRPLREGARWTYSGSSVAYDGAFPVRYTTETVQSGVGGGAATESQTNASNVGPDSQRFSVAAGVVSFPDSLDFTGKGMPEQVTIVELRSPVRQGDQWTMLEKRYTDTQIDADTDGKPDTLDMAIYARVIGLETVALPDLPPLQAVRVDIHLMARVTTSKDSLLSPVIDSVLQTWYAPGIGIVRQRYSTPASVGTGDETVDEVLTSWDGIEQGLGAMPPKALRGPADGAVRPGQELYGRELRSHRFQTHTLLLFQELFSGLQLAATLDARGDMTELKALPGVQVGAASKLAQLSDEHALVTSGPSDGTLQLTRISAQGSLVAPTAGVTLNLAGDRLVPSISSFSVTGDGNTLWLLFQRGYRDTDPFFSIRSELVLKGFNAAGQAISEERILDLPIGATFPTLQAKGGRLLLQWLGPEPGYEVMVAALPTPASPWVPQALTPALAGNQSYVYPVLMQDGAALLWASALGTGFTIDQASGIRLDTGFVPVRSSPDLAAEQLAGVPTYDGRTAGPQAVGNRLVLATTDAGNRHPAPPDSSGMVRVSWLDTAPTLALASTAVQSVRFRSGLPTAMSLSHDRALVFSDEAGLISVSLVWLNAGAL